MSNDYPDDEFDGRNDNSGISPEASDALKELDGLDFQQLLEKGRRILLQDLVAKAAMGLITHQEASVLRNMLRDNGMVFTPVPGTSGAPGAAEPANLPQFDDPDYGDE